MNRLTYLYIRRGSDTVAFVFSAFDVNDKQRKYNCVKSFKGLNIDMVFFSDPYGFRGSYYLLEGGVFAPDNQVSSLINTILNKGNYNSVFTMGTSKGGSAALYHGLKIGADEIIAGACQYRLGTYVAKYPDIFKGMTGHSVNDEDIQRLDNIMPEHLKQNKNCKTRIHLIHSKQEPTYEADEKYLIKDLTELGYDLKETECGFKTHQEIGNYYIPYVLDYMKSRKSGR